MKNNRREFLRKSTSMAALSVLGITPVLSETTDLSFKRKGLTGKSSPSKNYVKDAGIKMCFAYFGGLEAEKRKAEFGKQLNVLGAVGKISPLVSGSQTINPWEYEAVLAEKNAWEKFGLKLEVIEGPPALSEKTKLGLEGRDEEISNFITLMKNLSKVGIDTICYNWMPVISWARTTIDRPGSGRSADDCF